METMFVTGKRTRSRCQATGSAAPVPMAANTSAEAGPEKERPTRGCSLLGGAHHPTQRGGDGTAAPPCPRRRGEAGRWGCAPSPACRGRGGSLPRGRSSEGAGQGSRGAPCPPTAPWGRSVALPAAVSVGAARRPLRVTPRRRSGGRSAGGGGAAGGGPRSSPPALSAHPRAQGDISPSVQQARQPLPAHPSPALAAGPARPRRSFACPLFTLHLHPEETNPSSSPSPLHLQPPLAGVRGGEGRGTLAWHRYQRGEELQLPFRLMGSAGKSHTLLLGWVVDFFPQALLQSATHSLSAEDTIDFTHDRRAYTDICI